MKNNFKTKDGATVFIERKNKLGVYFDPSKEEYTEAVQKMKTIRKLESEKKSIEKQLEALKSQCQHEIVFDTAGFPYDTRRCFACGSSQGSI